MRHDDLTIISSNYRAAFWDKAMRGRPAPYDVMKGGNVGGEMFVLPYRSGQNFTDALAKESLFRRIATTVTYDSGDADVWVSDGEEPAEWLPNGSIGSLMESADVFSRKVMSCHKLATITRLDADIAHDIGLDLEKHMISHMAKRFGKAEDEAFVSGTGDEMPCGILHETAGAEVGLTADEVSFDNLAKLYFSVKPEYRADGVWLMNDETAFVLRTMKDAAGNYLWDADKNTILGRPVCLTPAMPSAAAGKKPVAFGDFRYYWIMNRMPLSVRVLSEKYALHGQIGYFACEYLDAKLIRTEAVKVLKIAG